MVRSKEIPNQKNDSINTQPDLTWANLNNFPLYINVFVIFVAYPSEFSSFRTV